MNEGNTLSFAQDTFSVFYQKSPYFTGNKVKVLKPKFDGMNDLSGLYLSSTLNKVLRGLSWWLGSTVESIWEFLFQIPVDKNWEIAFDFMGKYIKALEAERLEELEAYLLATGLKDYRLTEKEQLSLDKFEDLLTLEQNSKEGWWSWNIQDFRFIWCFYFQKYR